MSSVMTPSCSRVAHIVAFALLTAGVAGARDVTVRPGDGSPVTNRPREVLEDGYASSGAEAASLLGIGERTLWTKLKKHGL